MFQIHFKRSYLYLILSVFFSFSSCITDDYNDVFNNLNTDITIGGDSLSIPIGKTKPLLLGALINDEGIDILKKSENGDYSINYSGNYNISFNDIFKPVSFEIPPITIQPIKINLADIKFPAISFDPVSVSSTFNIPDIDVSTLSIQPINSTFSLTYTIPGLQYTKKISQEKIDKIKNLSVQVGPFDISTTKSVNQAINFNFPKELKKINFILLKNNTVNLVLDKSEINKLGFSSQNDTIKKFKIDFPQKFKLSANEGKNTKIEGNSFIIEDVAFANGQNIYTASFKVEKIDFQDLTQNNSLDINETIPYSIYYKFTGIIDSDINIANKELKLGFSLQSSPEFDDIQIVTNDIVIANKNGSTIINQEINNLPKEISEINSITLDDNAFLQLNIEKPNISPFDFSDGNCVISLPKLFAFSSFSNLNNTTNTLTIPYNELFTPKNIGISGIKLNEKVTDGKLKLNDAIAYMVSNLTIASKTLLLNTMKSIGTNQINVTGSTTGMVIKDATITTNKIYFDIPEQNSLLTINQLITKELKKIYTVNLKKPTEIQLKININNMPSGIDSVFFENYIIKLPDYLKFKDGNVNSKNEIILNRGFAVNKGFIKTVTLESLDFGSNGLMLENGYLKLSDAITMEGKTYIKGTSLNSNEIGSIEIIPSITMSTVDISGITGQIGMNIEPIAVSIPFNLPAELSNPANNLDIQKPVITLEIGNSTGIPLDVALQLVPKQNGSILPNSTLTTLLKVAAADTLGKHTWSKYWLATNDDGISADYLAILLPELPTIINKIPNEIELTIQPTITGEKHSVDLHSITNDIIVNYSINVPLSFGKDLKINYKNTIDSLKNKLTEYINYTKQIEIIAIVENEIPLDLQLKMAPLDSIKQVISGISLHSGDTIKSCNIDGSSRKSIISIALNETETGALQLLDAFEFEITASKNRTIAGLPLNANQKVTLELRVRIPKGISIKL